MPALRWSHKHNPQTHPHKPQKQNPTPHPTPKPAGDKYFKNLISHNFVIKQSIREVGEFGVPLGQTSILVFAILAPLCHSTLPAYRSAPQSQKASHKLAHQFTVGNRIKWKHIYIYIYIYKLLLMCTFAVADAPVHAGS